MGVIHRTAVLDDDEIPAAHSLGLGVLDRARPAFSLPCPRLAGTQCGIYADRPRVCARYRCQLLQGLDEGKTEIVGALVHIRTAMALLKDVRAVLPAGMSYGDAQRLTNGPAGAAVDLQGGDRELRLRTARLELYLDKHFRNSKDRRSFQPEAADMQGDETVSERRFRRSSDAIHGDVGGDVVALHIPRGRCYGMEDVTASVWKLLERPATIGEICLALTSEYEIEPEECRSDISELLAQMTREGLVEVAETSS